MDIAILSPDGHTRETVIVAADLATAHALYPGLTCVPRGTGADLLASDPATQYVASIADVTARQIRLALSQTGLRDAVEAAIAASPRDLRDWWEFSIVVERGHPLVAAMIQAIGVTPEQADAVWRLGAGL